MTTPGLVGESSARGKIWGSVFGDEDNLKMEEYSGQPGSISGGQIHVAQLVEHLIGNSEIPVWSVAFSPFLLQN
jgi:hypothetical protein